MNLLDSLLVDKKYILSILSYYDSYDAIPLTRKLNLITISKIYYLQWFLSKTKAIYLIF